MGAEARRTSVPSASRKKGSSQRSAPRSSKPSRRAPKGKPSPKPKSDAKPRTKSSPPAASPEPAVPVAPPRLGDGRRHVLSLSFLRDGDEFYARMESDSGQITELKNRSLDQLLTLVASELEDLLE